MKKAKAKPKKMEIPVVNHESHAEYARALKAARRGRRLGEGCFAKVYAPKQSKTEVNRVSIGIDRGHLRWLRLVGFKNKNPHLPYYYSATIHRQGEYDDEFFETRMERLIPMSKLDQKDIDAAFNRIVESSTVGAYSDEGWFEGFYFSNRWKAKTPMAGKLKALLKQADANDVHDGNVMFRKRAKGGYDVVVTDPCVEHY